MRIAILDHDTVQRDRLCQALVEARHSCAAASGIGELVAQAHAGQLDLAVIHFSGPHCSTAAADKFAKDLTERVPWLAITAKEEHEILAALEAGARDYLVKPLRMGELLMRAEVLLKRCYPDWAGNEKVRFDHYEFDLAKTELRFAGRPVALTRKEFALALLFFRNLGRPLSRVTLQEAVWPGDNRLSSRTLDTHVSRIRNKLGLQPEQGYRLAPVYSYGYLLESVGTKPAP